MHGLDKARVFVGAVIVGVWLGSIIVAMANPDFDVPLEVHALMMLVAGFLFGPTITGRARRNGDAG